MGDGAATALGLSGGGRPDELVTGAVPKAAGPLRVRLVFNGARSGGIGTKPHDGLKEQIRKLLADGGWRIEYDNQRYLQAVNRKGIPFLDCDLLILGWRSDEIRWALVYDPWYNMAGGIFTFNRYGRKTVKAIKALAGNSAEAPAPRKLG